MGQLLDALTGDAEVAVLLSDEAHVAGILRFEEALAQAEADVGLITTAARDAISEGIRRFNPDWDGLRVGMGRDGVVVPALIQQLREAIGEPYGSDLHFGATSQDAVDSSLVLQLGKIIPVLLARLDGVLVSLDGLESESGTLPLMAHTRMQAALPFTVAEKLQTWRAPLQRQRRELLGLSGYILVVQLGGPVGDRSSFGGKGDEVAERLAAILGLGNAPAWHSDRDRIVSLGSRLASLTGVLGKLGLDVALLAQSERGAVVLRGTGQSSAMPHKSNPVAAEVLVSIARKAAGLAGTLHTSLVHEEERSGSAWTTEWLTLPDLVTLTAASLSLALKLTSQLSFR
jgi:3-carboxy-cis,cis-muconate cycloisomerase